MAEELREEIDKNRSGLVNHKIYPFLNFIFLSFMVIRAGAQCSLCNELLLQRQFVAFICRHFFHRDCLESKTRVINIDGIRK